MKRPTILVNRPNDGCSDALRESGLEVLNLELIRTEPVNDLTEFTETIGQIGQYDGIFLTSPVAAEIFVNQLDGSGKSISGTIYVLGERSQAVLTGWALNVVYSETANTAQDLINSLGDAEFAGKRLLYIRGDKSVGTIRQMLTGKAEVDELIVYRTLENKPDDAAINDLKDQIGKNEIDWVCFFSPSGVKGFVSVFGGNDLSGIKGSAIGETTAAAVRELGINIDFISKRSNAKEFAAGLAAYIKSIE